MRLQTVLKGLRKPKTAYSFIKSQIRLRDRFRLTVADLLHRTGIAGFLQEVIRKEPYIHGDASRITAGENSSIGGAWCNTRSGEIVIGNDVMLSNSTFLLTGSHDYQKKGADRFPAVPEEGRDIIIQDGVWVGWRTTIIGPCEIGPNAVIAAGSVVVNDCEGGAIYAGNPAKKVATIDFE